MTGNSLGNSPNRPTLRWPIALVSLLIPCAFLPYIFDPFQLPKAILFHLGTVLILGVWLWGVVRLGSVRLARTGVFIPLLLLLFLGLLSVFQAGYHAEAFATVRDAVFAVVVFLLAASSIPARDRVVAGCLAFAGLLTGAAGLLQLLDGPRFTLLPPTMGGALVGDVSTAAIFVAMTLPLLAGLSHPYRGKFTWMWGLGTGVALAFIILARTRGAWLAALAGMLCLVLLRLRRPASGEPRREGAAAPAILVLCTGAALALAAVLWGVYGAGIRLASNPPSFKVSELEGWALRQDAWRITRGMLLSHPLGVGAGNWRYAFASEAGNASLRTGFSAARLPLQAGNEYLQTAAELGAAGLVLLLWVGISLVRTGWRRGRQEDGFPMDACTASLVGLFAAGMLSNPLREQPTLWAATILAALVCGTAGPAESSRSLPPLEWEMVPGRRKAFNGLATGMFLILAILSLWGAARILLASADSKLGQAACLSGDRARGLQLLLRAGRSDPTSAPTHAMAASCALQAGSAAIAEEEIRASLKLNPLDSSSWLTLAAVLDARGHLIDATAACEKARSFWPRDERINLLLGKLRTSTGDTLGAAQAYEAALSGNPSSVESYLREGQVLLSRGQIVNAVMALTQAANLDPFSPEVLAQLGAAYMREGDYESAVQSYRSLLGLNEDDPNAMLGLAGAYSGMQHYCDAIPLLKRARELQTDPARAASIESMLGQMTERCERSRANPSP